MNAVYLLSTLLLLQHVEPSLTDRGDAEFVAMDYTGAIALYEAALGAGEDSAAVLWRLARVYICRADVIPKEDQLPWYERAEQYASRSVRADPGRSEGHTWLASSLSNLAMSGGPRTKARLCRIIKNELEEAIRLDSCNDVAHSILGSFYRALGDLSWLQRQLGNLLLGGIPDGGYEDAEMELQTAISIAPWIMRHHSELGLVYLGQDRAREARKKFEEVLAMPVLLQNDVLIKNEILELLGDLEED